MKTRNFSWFLALGLILAVLGEGTLEARRKNRRQYQGPAPTHPVILWSRTIDEDESDEKRRVAAFKLSQYSQPIFQPKVVSTLLTCSKDKDVQIKVLCTKALGNAKSANQADQIRELLISQYNSDPSLKNTVVRAFLARKDDSAPVQKILLDALMKSEEVEETLVLLSYFEEFEPVSSDFADKMVELYGKRTNIKVRRSLVRVLGANGRAQDNAIELLALCATERDTPLALNCLAGLQSQAKKDSRAWAAIEKTILSDDPDVLLASLDVINAMPDNKNAIISRRLSELVTEVEDPDIQEKAVLALGVCGDQSEETVEMLQKAFKNDKSEEATRIAAALTLGKQAVGFPDKPKEMLSTCIKEGASQSLKSACQLGLNELKKAPPVASKGPMPASVPEQKEEIQQAKAAAIEAQEPPKQASVEAEKDKASSKQ